MEDANSQFKELCKFTSPIFDLANSVIAEEKKKTEEDEFFEIWKPKPEIS